MEDRWHSEAGKKFGLQQHWDLHEKAWVAMARAGGVGRRARMGNETGLESEGKGQMENEAEVEIENEAGLENEWDNVAPN